MIPDAFVENLSQIRDAVAEIDRKLAEMFNVDPFEPFAMTVPEEELRAFCVGMKETKDALGLVRWAERKIRKKDER